MSTYFEKNIKPKHRDAYWKDGKVFILNREGYDLAGEIDWLADPFDHRSWRWLLNNFKWMDTLLYRYLVEGDVASIQKCVDYFASWYSFYVVGQRSGEFLWKDDAVSFRAFRVAVIARYIMESDDASAAEKEMAIDAVHLHYNELIDEKKFKRNNHGLFQVRGLMTLSVVHSGIVSFEDAASYAEKKINYLWLQQYGTQGIHLENSTGYHQLTIKEFDDIIKSPEFSNVTLVYGADDVAKAVENTKYLYHPNGVSTLFGDSNLTIKDLPKFSGDRIFNEAGYAFLAGNDVSERNSYLAVRTGFPSNIHRHSDDFSFEWSEWGQVIFQDSGRYSYEYKNPYRVFLTSTRGHNTVTVNEGNYPWWGKFERKDFYQGAVTQYEGDKEKALIVLQKNFSSLGVSFNRKLNLIRGRSLTVADTLESKETNRYEQWFHFSEEFSYLGGGEDGRLIFESKKLRVSVLPASGVEVVAVKGQKNPYIQGWISYKEKHLQERWSIGFMKEGENCVLETKFDVLSL